MWYEIGTEIDSLTTFISKIFKFYVDFKSALC